MLLFCDSFDHWVTADAAAKWGQALQGAFTINSSAGRNSTAGLRVNSSGNNFGPKLALANTATVILGMAVNFASQTRENCLFSFYDAGTRQVTVNIQTDNKINIRRGATSSGTIIATSTNPVSVGAYHYFEIKIKFHNTTGTIDVQWDGAAVAGLSGLTGLNTRAGSNNYANEIYVWSDGTTASLSMQTVDGDDFYVCDDSGANNNNFLGDVRVQCVVPTGTGNSNAFTPSAGANWQCVDEAAQNGDTDYNESSNAGDIDLFATGDISPTSGTIKAVMVWMYAKKTDGGVRQLAGAVRSGGTNAFATTVTLGASYAYYPGLHELDPAAAAWTVTTVNSIEAGYKLIA